MASDMGALLVGTFYKVALVALLAIHVVSCNKYELVRQALEEFALGSVPTTALVREDLLGLVREYQNYSDDQKQDIKSGKPTDRLMLHFVILPALKSQKLLERKPEAFAHYKRLIENGYKKFRPAYFSQMINDGMVSIKFNKIMMLFKKLDDDVNSVTLKDFEDARDEAVVWQRRLVELVEIDDVYAHEKELASILNIMNLAYYRPLFVYVLPEVTPDSDPQELIRLYFEHIRGSI